MTCIGLRAVFWPCLKCADLCQTRRIKKKTQLDQESTLRALCKCVLDSSSYISSNHIIFLNRSFIIFEQWFIIDLMQCCCLLILSLCSALPQLKYKWSMKPVKLVLYTNIVRVLKEDPPGLCSCCVFSVKWIVLDCCCLPWEALCLGSVNIELSLVCNHLFLCICNTSY